MPVTIEDDDLPGEKPESKPAVKPAPVAKKADPEPEPPKKYQHVSRLVREALAAGLTQDDLDNHPSDVIAAELDRLERITASRTPPKTEPKAETKAEVDPEEAYLAELETTHAPLVKILRQAKKDREELAAIKEQFQKEVEPLKQAEIKRQQLAFDRALDKAFAALPAEYEPLVGTGSIYELSDPGQKGWRGAIYQAAKLEATDSPRQIVAKVLAAAQAVAGPHVKKAAESTSAYDTLPKKPQPKSPVNGRFTKEEFEAAQLHRPNGKQTGHDQLNAVEATRRYLKEIGDPRGDRPAVDFDDDDLPG